MAFVRLCILLLLMAISCGAAVVANTPENRAFNAAAEAFRAGFFDRSEREFGEFAAAFPESTRLAEALLFRAQSRIQLTNYAGAIELLAAGRKTAGPLADQYAFWTAEATLKQGDAARAADLFAATASEFPASPRAMEAIVAEASARAGLGQWDRISSALGQSNGLFQAALATNRAAGPVLRGALLLAQAHLVQGRLEPAEAILGLIASTPLDPALDWSRNHLLCRIRIAQQKYDEGLVVVTNLLRMSTNAAEPAWAPEAVSLQASILTKVGRVEEAVSAYEKNLAPGAPENYQREALLKVTELSIDRGRLAYAAQVMEKFAAQQTNSPVLDAVLLVSGELGLRQYAMLQNQSLEKAPQATNLLDQSSASLKRMVELFPKSALLGRACLNLGWCFWLQDKVAESQDAFKKASGLLPISIEQAVAMFKLGDAQLKLGDHTNAIASYTAVVDRYSENPEARTNFIERALYQTIRAAIPAGDRAAGTKALSRMLAWFPDGRLGERSVLLGGIEISKYNPEEARGIFLGFIKAFPNAELLPEVQLALARSYEQQGDWTNAIALYDAWGAANTNHPALARAEYSRAWSNAKAGLETNAFNLFSTFVARFPATEFTPLARWWLGDYELHAGQFENAERAYKEIFQSTNVPVSDTRLQYEATMMAGRAAFARQSGSQAAAYFTSLWNDTNCPADIRAQALFAYGDTLVSMETDETNRLANYDEAIRVFSRISEMFPTNSIGVLALGQKASCLMQWAMASGQYDAASNAFEQVIASPYADGRTRSIAKVGLASVLEKRAETDPAKKADLLKAAMDHCLDVLFGSTKVWKEGETADPFWVRKAGLDAARYAEARGEWEQASGIYRKLQELMPVLRTRMEKNIARAQEQLLKARQTSGAAEKK